jgi:hypothetical protein
VSDHVADCAPCRERLSAASKSASPRVLGGVRDPGAEPFHLSYELMRDHVKGKFDAVDRELVESHVADCGACRRELEDLTAFAQSLDQEEASEVEGAEPGFDWSQRRQTKQPGFLERLVAWWTTLSTGWLLTACGAALAMFLAVISLQMVNRPAAAPPSEMQPPPTVATAPPNAPPPPTASALPVPAPAPSPTTPSPSPGLKDGGTVIALKDGKVTGIPEDWPPELKEDVQAILSGAGLPASSSGLLSMNAPSAQPSRGGSPKMAPFAGPPKGHSSTQTKEAAPASHLARGLALWRAGNRDGARKEFEALAAENPDSPIAKQLMREARPPQMATKPQPMATKPPPPRG